MFKSEAGGVLLSAPQPAVFPPNTTAPGFYFTLSVDESEKLFLFLYLTTAVNCLQFMNYCF